MPIGVTIPTTFTAINRFSSPVRAMENSMRGFVGRSRAGIASLETGFRRALGPLTALQNTMRGLGLYIGLFSLVMLGRGALGFLAEFEAAQLRIQSVSPETKAQNKDLAMQARQMAVDYGKAATSVSDLQYELIKMGFNDPKLGGMDNVKKMTPAIMLGATAMEAPQDDLAKMVGASMNLFKMPAQDVVDLFSKGLDLSALDFESFSHMLRNSQQAWALSGKDLPSLITHLAILSNSFVHSASAGTGLKNITLDNAVAMKQMGSELMKIANSKNPLVTGKNMYGRKAVLAAFPLAAAMEDGTLDKLLGKLNATYKGYTEDLNNIKMQGITYKWNQAKAAWQELILSIDDGSGPLAASIRSWIDVGRAMFLIQANSSIAGNALGKMDTTVVALANKYLMWLKIIGYTAATLIALRVVIWSVRTALMVTNGIVVAAQFIWGIYNAVMKRNIIYTGAQTAATYGQAAAMWFLTLRTRLMNLAMTTTPLGWAILGFGLLAAALWSTSKGYDGVTDAAKRANSEQDKMKSVNDADKGIYQAPKTQSDLAYDKMKKRSEETAALMNWRKPISSFANIIKRDIGEDFARVKSMFMPDISDMSMGIGDINLNDLRQQDMMKQLMPVQNGNVQVDFNNAPKGTNVKANGGVSFKMNSTYYDYPE